MPTREEMIKKLRRQDMISKLRESDNQAATNIEDKPWWKSAMQTVNDWGDKFEESMTLGYRDEIQGGMKAAIDKIKGSDEPFSDLYEKARDDERLRLEQIQKRSPVASTLGTLAGGIIAPSPVGKVKGLAGIGKAGAALGAEGAVTGLGYSDAELDSMEAVADAATGGVINTALPGAGALTKKGVNKLAPDGISNLLKRTAEARAAKASHGNQSKYSEPLRRKGRAEARGRALLDEGIMDGAPSAATISERAQEGSQKAWNDMEEVLNKVDSTEPNAVNAKEIADKIIDYASSKEAPNNKAFINNMMEQASEFEAMGNIPMAEAHRLKKQYKWDDRDPTTQSLGKEATNKLNKLLSNALEDSVAKVEAKGGDDIKGLLDQYKSAKSRYGHLADAAKSSKDLASRQDKNRTFSLSDYITGMSSMGVSGNPMIGLAAAGGNKILRHRGSSAAAKGLDEGSKVINKLSEKTLPLQTAAKEVRPSIAATRTYMEATDKDYQQLLEDRLQRSEEEKRKAKMREILRDYYQLQKAE